MSGPKPGTPALNKRSLEKARVALTTEALARGWVMSLAPADVDRVARAAIIAYIIESREHARSGVRAETLRLASMNVGDAFEVADDTPRQSWKAWVKAARDRMFNRRAAWAFQRCAATGALRVERLPDGAPWKAGREPGTKVLALARMAPGESIIGDWRKLETTARATARRRIGDPLAVWTCRRINKGLKVTRVR